MFYRIADFLVSLITGGTYGHDPRRRAPLWLRRLVVLTFPVSVPSLVVISFVTMILGLVEDLVVSFWKVLERLWRA